MSFSDDHSLHCSGWHSLADSWKTESVKWSKHKEITFCLGMVKVVWSQVNSTNNNIATNIAFIGCLDSSETAPSVFVLKDVFGEPSWEIRPDLHVPCSSMGACACNGYLYVIGGQNELSHEREFLDRIERIPLLNPSSNNLHNKNKCSWSTLDTCLSEARVDCAVVTVHDRFVVVAGGRDEFHRLLSAVEIIDTMTPVVTDTKNQFTKNDKQNHTIVTIIAGPRLQRPRCLSSATVVDNQIWVVGGRLDEERVFNIDCDIVECLQFGLLQTNNNDSSQSIFASEWNLRPDLSLCQPRCGHSAAMFGRCLVVAGGCDDNAMLHGSVELLDPHRGVVLELPCLGSLFQCTTKVKNRFPNMVYFIRGCTMVEIPHQGLVAIGHDAGKNVCMQSLAIVNLSLLQLKNYLEKIESRPPSFIPISERKQKTDSLEQLQRSEVESLFLSLVFYYLFYKAGDIPCAQHQVQQKLKRSFPNNDTDNT